MHADDTEQLIYLILLGLMVLIWFFAQNRLSLNKTLQQAAVWGLIFLGAIAAYGLWNDISQTLSPRQISVVGEDRIIAPRQGDGHYYLTLQVNGAPIEFVVDTGASEIVLTKADAEKVGLSPDTLTYLGVANTANGQVRTAMVRLDEIRLGSVTDLGVTALVNEGQMRQSLLGMGYLQRWGRIEIAAGELILTR